MRLITPKDITTQREQHRANRLWARQVCQRQTASVNPQRQRNAMQGNDRPTSYHVELVTLDQFYASAGNVPSSWRDVNDDYPQANPGNTVRFAPLPMDYEPRKMTTSADPREPMTFGPGQRIACSNRIVWDNPTPDYTRKLGR